MFPFDDFCFVQEYLHCSSFVQNEPSGTMQRPIFLSQVVPCAQKLSEQMPEAVQQVYPA
jgi:hypothetical protein